MIIILLNRLKNYRRYQIFAPIIFFCKSIFSAPVATMMAKGWNVFVGKATRTGKRPGWEGAA